MPQYRTLCLALASTALLQACSSAGDNDDGGGGGGGGNQSVLVDLRGTWTFAVDVTQANGVCEGEQNDPVVPFDVTFTVTDANGDGVFDVTATGDFGDAGGSISGTVDGDQVVGDILVLTGDIAEDGGTTSSTYTLSIESTTRLEGVEDWSWTGGGGTCPGGEATVVASR